jgi:hypothetical protein
MKASRNRHYGRHIDSNRNAQRQLVKPIPRAPRRSAQIHAGADQGEKRGDLDDRAARRHVTRQRMSIVRPANRGFRQSRHRRSRKTPGPASLSRKGASRKTRGDRRLGIRTRGLRRGDPNPRTVEREIRVPGQLGRRPAVGARALSDREIREKACHRDELPEGHQSLLYAGERRRPDGSSNGSLGPGGSARLSAAASARSSPRYWTATWPSAASTASTMLYPSLPRERPRAGEG